MEVTIGEDWKKFKKKKELNKGNKIMRNIKLTIEYDGSGFNGWQKQPKIKGLN